MASTSVAPAYGDSGPKSEPGVRPSIQGKFIFVGAQKFYVKGVTYEPFRPADVGEFHDIGQIRRDFAAMARYGVNTVRIQHTTTPTRLLDIAAEYGLQVMVGLSAEHYAGYLLDRRRLTAARKELQSKVRACAGHPALLCYALGNEISASVARWAGRQHIERYLEDLYDSAKSLDPEGIVTYVNYPGTEYLQLPFLDMFCFNVYLERKQPLDAYLARLHNIAVDRPLVLSGLGLDSRTHGLQKQANGVSWQIRTAFDAGCAGAVVFSWTDGHLGGGDVTDCGFGLTDQEHRPKPALEAVRKAFTECPFPPSKFHPFISVVVCSYNGARTIDECLAHLMRLRYPAYEVIVVDDGSTDRTSEIALSYNVRLIRTENRGLSAARNTGLDLAKGEIVAYIDDDAYPDIDWLNYLARAFGRTSHAMIGGPNLAPFSDGLVAQCVARSPGGPNHVLLTDTVAEHVPGCNMAFRKSHLREIGGFDPRFRVAGDDVDVCWRIQEMGWTIGFSPAALVWHHRRSSIRAYFKQQRGYGKAESLLYKKWPSRFNASNHLPWAGCIYVPGSAMLMRRSVIYHGVWGQAPFQTLHSGVTEPFEHLIETPELNLVTGALLLLSAMTLLWHPMLVFIPLLCCAIAFPLHRAAQKARRANFFRFRPAQRCWMRALTAALHVLQPVVRLWGRVQHGLTPWKRRGSASFILPHRLEWARWTDRRINVQDRLRELEDSIRSSGLMVSRGNEYEAWDLNVQAGLLGSARLIMAVEDHGRGRQYVRLAAWPRFSRNVVAIAVAAGIVAGFAVLSDQMLVTLVFAAISTLLLIGSVLDTGRSLGAIRDSTTAARQPFCDDPNGRPLRIEPASRVSFVRVNGGSNRRSANG